MQDRYAGDIGDYSKLGLLRALFPGKRIGLVWYAYPDEDHNGDGRHTSYLESENFRACDPELHQALGVMVAKGKRSIKALEQANTLPNATFFSALLDSRGTPKLGRLAARTKWHDEAKKAVSGCPVIMVDPDNGIASQRMREDDRLAGKFIFPDEIKEFYRLPGVEHLVIYHHFSRQGSHLEQTERLHELLAELLPRANIAAINWRAVSGRCYLVVSKGWLDTQGLEPWKPFLSGISKWFD